MTSKLALAPANVPADWRVSEVSRTWEAPVNVVHGESFHQEALWLIVGGKPARDGKLMAVEANLIRESWNPHGAEAIRVETCEIEAGHVAKEVVLQLSPILDSAGCAQFGLAGIIRGGSKDAPLLGLHLWLGRRVSPGPELWIKGDPGSLRVPWPPGPSEGKF